MTGRLRAAAGVVSTRAVAGAVAMRVAAVLLGAGCLVWAALPTVHRGYAGFALVLAIAGVAAGGLRLAWPRSQRTSTGPPQRARRGASTWCGGAVGGGR
jgi:hypothetical protein